MPWDGLVVANQEQMIPLGREYFKPQHIDRPEQSHVSIRRAFRTFLPSSVSPRNPLRCCSVQGQPPAPQTLPAPALCQPHTGMPSAGHSLGDLSRAVKSLSHMREPSGKNTSRGRKGAPDTQNLASDPDLFARNIWLGNHSRENYTAAHPHHLGESEASDHHQDLVAKSEETP